MGDNVFDGWRSTDANNSPERRNSNPIRVPGSDGCLLIDAITRRTSSPRRIIGRRSPDRCERPCPRRYIASSTLVFPAPLFPSTAVTLVCNSSSECRNTRKLTSSACVITTRNVCALQAHRHHNVSSRCIQRIANQATGIRVGKRKLHLRTFDRTEGLQEIRHIEPDLQRLP